MVAICQQVERVSVFHVPIRFAPVHLPFTYERYLKDSDLKEERIQALMQEVETERKTRKECEKVLRKIMEIGSNYSSAGNVT